MSWYAQNRGFLQVMTALLVWTVARVHGDVSYPLSSEWSVINNPSGPLREFRRYPTDSIFRVIFANSNVTVLLGFHDTLDGFSTLSIALNPGNISSSNSGIHYPYQVVWSANRNNPVGVNATLKMSGGNLVLEDNVTHREVWSPTFRDGYTNTSVFQVSGIKVQDSGNVQLYGLNNIILWQSFDHPTDTFVLNSQYGANLTYKMALVAGTSSTNSSEGGFKMVMEAEALVFYTTMGSSNVAQPYGIVGNVNLLMDAIKPELSGFRSSAQIFVDQNKYGGKFANLTFVNFIVIYGNLGAATGFSFVLTQQLPGFLRLLSDGRLQWYNYDTRSTLFPTYYWNYSDTVISSFFPRDRCWLPTSCGPYGVCSNSSMLGHICNCPSGEVGDSQTRFQPLNGSDLSQGCYPTRQRNCDASTVALLEIKEVTYFQNGYMMPLNITISECKQRCLDNCSFAAAFYEDNTTSCYLVQDVLTMYNISDANYRAFLKIKVDQKSHQKHVGALVVSIVIASGVFVVLVGVLSCIWRTTKMRQGEQEDPFRLKELEMATQNFSKLRGEGIDAVQPTMKIFNPLFSGDIAIVAQSFENYLELSNQCMKETQKIVSSTLLEFNHGQCEHLLSKLTEAVRIAHASCSLPPEHEAPCFNILKLLFQLAKEVETFILSCCDSKWIRAAILMTNVSYEHASSLNYDLDLCTALFRSCNKLGAELPKPVDQIADEANLFSGIASLDRNNLVERLEDLVRTASPSDPVCQLGTYLLNRLTATAASTPDLSRLSHWKIDYSSIERSDHMLGKGSAGTVHTAVWLEAKVAEKRFFPGSLPDHRFITELAVLAGLCHPYIASLLGYAMDERNCSIIMELMDRDLLQLMESRLRRNSSLDAPFSIGEAVDIMLQVAEGLYYLHLRRVVHRDLKSSNVLTKCAKYDGADADFVSVKVADFELSKIKKLSSTFSYQTPNVGSSRWMPPELQKGKHIHEGLKYPFRSDISYPFKGDVYSFGMVCIEILTGKVPFPDLSNAEVKKKVVEGHRPCIPRQCPEELRNLIQCCWNPQPKSRPSVGEVVMLLKRLKCSLLIGNPLPEFILETIMIPMKRLIEDQRNLNDSVTMAKKNHGTNSFSRQRKAV